MEKKNYIKPALKAFEVKSAPLCISGSVEGPSIGDDDQVLSSKSFSGGLIDDEAEGEDTKSLY